MGDGLRHRQLHLEQRPPDVAPRAGRYALDAPPPDDPPPDEPPPDDDGLDVLLGVLPDDGLDEVPDDDGLDEVLEDALDEDALLGASEPVDFLLDDPA